MWDNAKEMGGAVPKEEFWPVLQLHCFEFLPGKKVLSLSANDGVASFTFLWISPKTEPVPELLSTAGNQIHRNI